jgi:hypothetical protein
MKSLSLPNGKPCNRGSSCTSSHDFSIQRSFHPEAQLGVFNFRSAAGPKGTLQLKVIYDMELLGLNQSIHSTNPLAASQSSKILTTKLSIVTSNYKRTPFEAGSIISAGTFSIPVSSPAPNGTFESLQQTPMDIPSRKSASSPFPSPQMQRRVLSLASKQLPNHSSSKRTTSIRKSSNLQFNVTDRESEEDGNPDQMPLALQLIDTRILTPDGIEIYRASLSEDEFVSDRMMRKNESGIEDQYNIIKPDVRRRESLPSELFGSFVGSYEESILIGRMSTTPSKPITFLAEIGVLGIGKCKPSLKCPPHLLVGFSAFFYQLPDEDVPTPYVGTIDLVNPLGDDQKPLGYRLPNKGQLQIVKILC